MTTPRTREARGPVRSYSVLHPDSPITLGFDHAGPVHVPTDRADLAHAVSRKDLATAYGLGVCSATRGLEPDSHQVATGLRLDLTHPSDYLAWWVSTALQWHRKPSDDGENPDEADAYEAARVAQLDQWAAELVAIAPVWFVDWLTRLIHKPKWELLVEMGAQAWLDGPTPRDPQTDWSVKMGRQWARRFESSEIVERVTHGLRDLEEF